MNPLMTDKQVADFLGISLCTLQDRMRNGFRKDEVDLRKACPQHIGRRRFWVRSRVMSLIGVE